MASRIAARSTTQGTPVKSCSTTRAGMNEISFGAVARGVPLGEGFDVGRLDEAAVLLAQQVLEQDLQRKRQPRDARKSVRLQGLKTVVVNLLLTDGEAGARSEAIRARHRCPQRKSNRAQACSPARAQQVADFGRAALLHALARAALVVLARERGAREFIALMTRKRRRRR